MHEELKTVALVRNSFDAVGSLQWPLHEVVAELHAARSDWRAAQHRDAEPGSRELPSRDVLTSVTRDLRGALFPLRLGPADLPPASEDSFVGFTLDRALNILLGQVRLELRYSRRHETAERNVSMTLQHPGSLIY